MFEQATDLEETPMTEETKEATMHDAERMELGTATLESYAGRAGDGLDELSEVGALYPLIAYPAPADDLEPEAARDPLISAGAGTP